MLFGMILQPNKAINKTPIIAIMPPTGVKSNKENGDGVNPGPKC